MTYMSPFSNEEQLRKAFGQLYLNNAQVKDFWIYYKKSDATLRA